MEYRKLSIRGAPLAILFFCTWGLSHPLRAQQVDQTQTLAAPEAQTPATPQTQTTPATAPGAATGQSTPPETPQTQTKSPSGSAAQSSTARQVPKDDRIFFALPNLLTVENASSMPPLTTKQKFKTVAEGCFDPVEVVFIAIQAGIGQMDNTNPTYHQGLIGYSKRFGTDYADAIIGNFGTGAIFPTLLHQDPRYYQMGTGNFFRRFGYAAIRVVVTRSDTSGKHEFNFSEFLGNGMAAGLSNTYHPGPHTIASNTNVLETQILLDALGYELKEFWPDIRRLIVRGKHKN